jgi:hypothetical protein
MTVISMAKPPPLTITLPASELTDIIDCLMSSADRAESLAYELKGLPKQKTVRARAARLYALADRLDAALADYKEVLAPGPRLDHRQRNHRISSQPPFLFGRPCTRQRWNPFWVTRVTICAAVSFPQNL